MAYKILTKNGIENTNIDGARGEYFNSGMRDGIVQGVLNEGLFTATASNIISLDTCELRIAGHRIVIDEPVYHTFTNAPSSDTRYAFVAQIVVDANQNVDFSLFVQTANTPLIQNDLYKTITGVGTYQIEIGRFTLLTTLTIEDVVRTIDVITGGIGKGSGAGIEIGNVTTQTLDPDVDAEVDVDSRYEEDEGKEYLDFKFGIPGGKSGTVAELVPSGTDINTYRGSAYWGKTFYAGGNNTVQNLPHSNGAGFSLEVLRSGRYSTIQRLSTLTSEGNKVPTVYTRSVVDTATEASGTWSEWQEVAEANGTYPDMTVGGAEYLSKRHRLQTDGVQQGWLKIGTVPMSAVVTYQCYNCIMIISGVYRGTRAAATAPKTAIVEIESRKYASSLGDTRIGVLAGDIPADSLCLVVEDNLDVSCYIYNNYTENIDIQFEILSEELSNKTHANIFEFSTDDTALASAPSGAVYAVVRNNASGDENGNGLMSHATRNKLLNGTTSYDFNDYVEWGNYELHGTPDNPLVNAPTSTSNPSSSNSNWYLSVFKRDSVYVTQVVYSVRSDAAMAIRVLANGNWGEWKTIGEGGGSSSTENIKTLNGSGSFADFYTDIQSLSSKNIINISLYLGPLNETSVTIHELSADYQTEGIPFEYKSSEATLITLLGNYTIQLSPQKITTLLTSLTGTVQLNQFGYYPANITLRLASAYVQFFISCIKGNTGSFDICKAAVSVQTSTLTGASWIILYNENSSN